ncbi:MAG: hypothetical protein M0007_03675, partial [Actinomycetota bacterium]|nr:hypothetical protein [Actinomycetota bacterium]
MAVVVSAVAVVPAVAGVVPAGAATSSLVLLDEPFTGSQVLVPADWTLPALPSGVAGTNVACLTASGSTTQTPIPGCSSTPIDTVPNGTLRLTSATGNQDGGISYAGAVPSSQGLDIHFDTYQYGGTGADGILFYLAGTNPLAPAPPSTLGPPGGHLGYSGGTAAPTGNGLAGGYLGIGFDAYGNYVNPSFDGNGCTNPSWATGASANQVSVRGPGSGQTGYCLLSSTEAAGGLSGYLDGDSAGATTRAGSLVPVEIAINPTASPVSTSGIANVPAYSYVVAVSPLSGPTQYVTGALPNASAFEPASWLDPATGIPYQLALGFAASTGGSNDIHEIRNVSVLPLFSNPAQIALQLTDSAAGHLVAGSPVTYTATASVSPNGGSLSQTASFTDTFPTGITPGTATGANWSCTTTGQTVSCAYAASLLPLTPGTALAPITIPATVSAGATGTITDTGQLVSDAAVTATANDTGTVTTAATSPVLGVSLSDNVAGSFTQGGSAIYSAVATVSSTGTAESKTITLASTLPAGVTPGVATGANWACSTTGQSVSCTDAAGVVAAGTTLPTVSIPVTVATTTSGGITTTVTASSSDGGTVSATDHGAIVSVPQYGLTLTDSVGGKVPTRGSFSYTATASLLSTSGTESLDPTYTQVMALGITASAATGTGWTCSISTNTSTTISTVQCTYAGTIPAPGGSFPPITITAKKNGSGTRGMNVSSSGSVSSPDGIGASATDYATIAGPPPPVLSVSASSPSQAYAGTTYTLSISPSLSSTGGSAATDPAVQAVLPAGESFPSTPTPAGYTCVTSTSVNTNDTLTCTSTLATPISAGTSLGVISATVAVAAGTATGSLATAVTLSDTTDGAVTASTATAVDVIASPVFTVGVNGPASAPLGGTATFDVAPGLSATGGSALSDPTVTLTANGGFTFLAAPSPSGYACTLTSPTVVTCTYNGALPLGAGTSMPAINVSAHVGSPTGGGSQPGLTATVTDGADGASAATTSDTVSVTTAPVLAVTTSGTPSNASYGSSYVLTVTPSVGASGGPASNDPVVTVTFPTGESFAAAPTPTGYGCVLSSGNTVLTCTSTAATPISAGTSL